jgi:hypothetical protein
LNIFNIKKQVSRSGFEGNPNGIKKGDHSACDLKASDSKSSKPCNQNSRKSTALGNTTATEMDATSDRTDLSDIQESTHPPLQKQHCASMESLASALTIEVDKEVMLDLENTERLESNGEIDYKSHRGSKCLQELQVSKVKVFF